VSNAPTFDHCLTPNELARRWRTRPAKIRRMIRNGSLPAIAIDGRPRVTPEAILEAERGPMAVRPVRRAKRLTIPPEVAAMLE
jgi:hypothetical protein